MIGDWGILDFGLNVVKQNFSVLNLLYKIPLLNSPAAHKFYTSLIFWDEKRPIKSSILNCLNLTKLAEESAITTETQFLG